MEDITIEAVVGTKFELGETVPAVPAKAVRKGANTWAKLYDALPADGSWREVHGVNPKNTGYRTPAKAANVRFSTRGDRVFAQRSDA